MSKNTKLHRDYYSEKNDQIGDQTYTTTNETFTSSNVKNYEQSYLQPNPQLYKGQPPSPVQQKYEPETQNSLSIPLFTHFVNNDKSCLNAKKIKIISITGILLAAIFCFFNYYILRVKWQFVFLFISEIAALLIGLILSFKNGKPTHTALKNIWKLSLVYTVIWGVYYIILLVVFIKYANYVIIYVNFSFTTFFIAYFFIVVANLGPRIGVLFTCRPISEENVEINNQVY